MFDLVIGGATMHFPTHSLEKEIVHFLQTGYTLMLGSQRCEAHFQSVACEGMTLAQGAAILCLRLVRRPNKNIFIGFKLSVSR